MHTNATPCPSTPPCDAAPVVAGAVGRPPCWRSQDLFAGQREVLIDHEGQCYRLRITALGKLILTK